MRLNNLSRFAVQMRNVHYWLLLFISSCAKALVALGIVIAIFKLVISK